MNSTTEIGSARRIAMRCLLVVACACGRSKIPRQIRGGCRPCAVGREGGWVAAIGPRAGYRSAACAECFRRLTFGGQNAEAYWSTDGSQLMLQSRALGDTCDRIYRFDVPLAAFKASRASRPEAL